MSKNIVLCLDGTHNQISGVNTNVWRLYTALTKDETQVTYYDPGVGTMLDSTALTFPRRMARWLIDLATATSLQAKFTTAYQFLVNRYEPGDRIYIFGFSRGAYTARAVAGAINVFGLLKPGYDHLIPYIWQTYGNDRLGRNTNGESILFETAQKFRKELSRTDVPIHFLGVWDTVSAYGMFTRFRTLPSTRANPSILTVRQAASIDEKRSFFRLNRLATNIKTQDFKEVWFAGYHSDIGGGFKPPENGLGLVTLKWMIGEAEAKGIEIKTEVRDNLLSRASYDAPMHNSMGLSCLIMEFLPVRTWNKTNGNFTWHLPNWFRRRHIEDNAMIHTSVDKRRSDVRMNYHPRNLPSTCTVVNDIITTPTTYATVTTTETVTETKTGVTTGTTTSTPTDKTKTTGT
jgi:uncharacterized protein (DUF2235 family)